MSIYYDIDKLIDEYNCALMHNRSLSMVRIGDGENAILSHATNIEGYNVNDFFNKKHGWIRDNNYSSLKNTNDLVELNNLLLQSIRTNDIIGLLPNDYSNIASLWSSCNEKEGLKTGNEYRSRKLTELVLAKQGIVLDRTCDAMLCTYIWKHESFWKLIENNHYIYICGDRHIQPFKYIVGKTNNKAYANCNKIITNNANTNMNDTLSNISKSDSLLYLVCVGINKFYLISQMKQMGLVVLDIGQTFRRMLNIENSKT